MPSSWLGMSLSGSLLSRTFRQDIVRFSSLWIGMAAASAWSAAAGIGGNSAWAADALTPPPLSAPSPAPSAPPPAPLSEAAQQHLRDLQDKARSLKLAHSPMWRTLLHYQQHPLTRSDRSLADDPDFFLSPVGAHDAQRELDATLAAFFDPTVRHALEQNAACRFIARYQWLDSELGFDKAVMPAADCPRYRQWREGIRADKVTLIFPSAYLNSPASMYGHTFLRLDPKTEPGQTASPLLSYAIN